MKSLLSQFTQIHNTQKKKLFQTQESQKTQKNKLFQPQETQKTQKKKNKDCIDETFKRHLEWYIPTSDTTKSFILHILYVVKDFFRSNYKKEPTRSEIKTKITELSDVNLHFTEDIEELHWDKLRGFTKAM